MLTSAVAAAADTDTAALDGVYAVVNTVGGDISVDEAPAAERLGDIESYELFVEGEAVLSVEKLGNNSPTAVEPREYYSVDFTIEGTENEVFLTGLSPERVEEIQNEMIANYVTGENFDLTDVSFIDAEKLKPNGDGDDYLCWAASTSNMLTYTGWAAQAGFNSEDDLYEALIASFDDDGGNQYNGFAWFFNGIALGRNDGMNNAKIKDYPNSGGYLKEYPFEAFSDIADIHGVSELNDAVAFLREGCAVGIGLDLYYAKDNGLPGGGHAVTLWGFVVDNSLAEDDPLRYKSIFITDSDSDEVDTGDRRDSPNVMSLYNLLFDEEGGYYFWYEYGKTSASIFDYIYLRPYSEDIEKESDPAATKDKLNSPDIGITDVFVTETNGEFELNPVIETGSTVYVNYWIQNFADAAYSGYIYPDIEIKDSSGKTVFSKSRVYNVNITGSGLIKSIPFLSYEGIAEGDYTLVCHVNPDHNARNVAGEAFYINNVKTVSFKVRDSYILGDFDGNGFVDILDATKIQRKLAGFEVTADERADIRGDVNGSGLSIMDVTQIQRNIADLGTVFPVGEKQLYE